MSLDGPDFDMVNERLIAIEDQLRAIVDVVQDIARAIQRQ